MLKRISALLLAAVMLLCLAACGDEDNYSRRRKKDTDNSDTASTLLDYGTVTQELEYEDNDFNYNQDSDTSYSATISSEDEYSDDFKYNTANPLTLGDTSSDCWENVSLGIGFELPADWEFSSQDEIETLTGFAADALSEDELKEQLENGKAVYDMVASDINNTGDNINVVLQKMPIKIDASDMEEGVETIADSFEEMVGKPMESIGFEILDYETKRFYIDGEVLYGISSSYNMSSANIHMYQAQIYVAAGTNTIAIITITSFSEEKINEFKDYLYII